jgi:hypothetical protein
MAEPFLHTNCYSVLALYMSAPPVAFVQSNYGRAISVEKPLTVFIIFYGRAISRLMHFNCGRAISARKLLAMFIVIYGRAICKLMHSKYGRAIFARKLLYLSSFMAAPFADLCILIMAEPFLCDNYSW